MTNDIRRGGTEPIEYGFQVSNIDRVDVGNVDFIRRGEGISNVLPQKALSSCNMRFHFPLSDHASKAITFRASLRWARYHSIVRRNPSLKLVRASKPNSRCALLMSNSLRA